MLETKSLILKQGSIEDWESLYENLWRHDDVFCYMFNKASATQEAGKKRTALYVEMQKEVKTEFFVYEKASQQAIGIAGMKETAASIFTITDIAIGPHYSGKGYGTQILKALLKYAFEELNAKEVHYDCFQQNEASRNLALSCGFQYLHSEEAELQKNGAKVILDYFVRKR